MADKHPYVSGGGILTQVINQFRSSFPTVVNAATLQKLGLAPNNESYVPNILRFLKLIDEDGNRTPLAAEVFSQHDDAQFSAQFGEVVKNAYTELFELHGDKAWDLDKDALTTFFRGTDHTSEIVGGRQAGTFQVLAAFAGHGEPPQPKTSSTKSTTKSPKKGATSATSASTQETRTDPLSAKLQGNQGRDLGLTVRIEINLPSDADQDTYDRIFKSIKENLLDG